jgi:hypothetical protein
VSGQAQPGLFRRDHGATAKLAAFEIAPSVPELQQRILDHLAERGRAGATDREMQHDLDMDGNTQRPRRRELQQAGRVVPSGEQRLTASGRPATVWVLARFQS